MRGEVVKAYVVAVAGRRAERRAGRGAAGLVRERLAAYEYPREVEFVDELPLTVTGKIRRAELRRRDRGSVPA